MSFSKFPILNRYRYENDIMKNIHSPLNNLVLKDLTKYIGKCAKFDLLMADKDINISQYASLYIAKEKLGVEMCRDSSIEWQIDEERLRFDFLGIKILKGTLQRQKCYEETNSYIRLRIIEHGIEIYKKNSNLIRHTIISKKQSLKIATCGFQKPGDPDILTIQFIKPQPYYESEFQLSNGEQIIDSYHSASASPCLKVKFDLSEMENRSTQMSLINTFIRKSVKVILPNLKKVSKKCYATSEEQALTIAGSSNEMEYAVAIMDRHSSVITDNDKIFCTPSMDWSPMEEISANDVEQIFKGISESRGNAANDIVETGNAHSILQIALINKISMKKPKEVESATIQCNNQSFLPPNQEMTPNVLPSTSVNSMMELEHRRDKYTEDFKEEDFTRIDEEFNRHLNSFMSNPKF